METRYERELAKIRNGDPAGSEGNHGSMAQGQPAWWEALTTEQREIHYERFRTCPHEYKYVAPPGYGEELREPNSFDIYTHTAHMEVCCLKSDPKCDCQMCLQKIGIAREGRFK